MLRASALYIVIIIALVIALICSSLIVAAYFYKIRYQQKFRYEQLSNNLNSGITILLSGADSASDKETKLSLFGGDADSVSLKNMSWGIYDIEIVKAFIQKDTLYKVFSAANSIDSSKWAAIYLVDEDRPFSLSGKTKIQGNAFIPKAGVQEAYIDGKAYEGDKRLIIGKKDTSKKSLPALNTGRLTHLQTYLNSTNGDSVLTNTDSLKQSFLQPTHFFNFKKKLRTIQNITLTGNIVLRSDTTLTIDGTASLNNILVFAKSIIVKSGFHGSCQLFATDSITVEGHCTFDYPSCLGVIRFQASTGKTQETLSIGSDCNFTGAIFTYEKADNPLKPSISIGKNTVITGQLYSQGLMELKDNTVVDGSVFTSLFYYKNAFTIYENYLINTTIDSRALSPYYLTSDLLPVAKKQKKVLQWIASN